MANIDKGKVKQYNPANYARGGSYNVPGKTSAVSANNFNPNDSKSRLWASLQTTYGNRIDQSNQQYDLNKAAADRAAGQRGMGRSSYNLATMANIDTEKAKAADRINAEMIADYNNQLTALEQREQEQANWQAQFDAQQEQWKQQFNYQQKTDAQQIAFNVITASLESGDSVSDALLAQAGISRHDYEQMKASARRTGGGPGGKPWLQYGMTEAEWNAMLQNYQNGQNTDTSGQSTIDSINNFNNQQNTTSIYGQPGYGSYWTNMNR